EDAPVDPGRGPGRLDRDVLAVAVVRGAGDVERAEDGRLGGPGRAQVRERVDEHQDAERVGPEDELLAAIVGDVPGRGQGGDRLAPLLLREPDLGDEAVQVADEGL